MDNARATRVAGGRHDAATTQELRRGQPGRRHYWSVAEPSMNVSPLTRLTDQIRPDWEAKLAAVRAAVARRANRRIIMRQVGDRLIPVGISSGRIHALQPEDVVGENGEGGSSERGSRRSRRRNQNPDLNQYLGQGAFTGQDLEEVCQWRFCIS